MLYYLPSCAPCTMQAHCAVGFATAAHEQCLEALCSVHYICTPYAMQPLSVLSLPGETLFVACITVCWFPTRYKRGLCSCSVLVLSGTSGWSTPQRSLSLGRGGPWGTPSRGAPSVLSSKASVSERPQRPPPPKREYSGALLTPRQAAPMIHSIFVL